MAKSKNVVVKSLEDKKAKRIVLDFNEEGNVRLEKMGLFFHTNKKTQLCRLALGLLETYVKYSQEGFELAVRKNDKTEQIIFPQQF